MLRDSGTKILHGGGSGSGGNTRKKLPPHFFSRTYFIKMPDANDFSDDDSIPKYKRRIGTKPIRKPRSIYVVPRRTVPVYRPRYQNRVMDYLSQYWMSGRTPTKRLQRTPTSTTRTRTPKRKSPYYSPGDFHPVMNHCGDNERVSKKLKFTAKSPRKVDNSRRSHRRIVKQRLLAPRRVNKSKQARVMALAQNEDPSVQINPVNIVNIGGYWFTQNEAKQLTPKIIYSNGKWLVDDGIDKEYISKRLLAKSNLNKHLWIHLFPWLEWAKQQKWKEGDPIPTDAELDILRTNKEGVSINTPSLPVDLTDIKDTIESIPTTQPDIAIGMQNITATISKQEVKQQLKFN